MTDNTFLLIASFALIYASGQAFIFFFSNTGEADSLGELALFVGLPFVVFIVLAFASLVPLYTLLERAPSYEGAAADVWQCLMAFFPALFANQCAGWARKLRLPGSKRPINALALGESKTWAQVYAIPGAFIAVATQLAIPAMRSTLVDYHDAITVVAVGLASGTGASLGDILESFLKRRRGIEPGRPWWPWDQTDFAIASAILLLPFLGRDLIQELVGFMLMMVMFVHPVGNLIGMKLKLRNRVL